MAVTGIVGGNQAIFIRERGNQIAEHLRTGREAVQKQDCWSVFRPGVAVKDVKVTDPDGLVEHLHRLLCRDRAGRTKDKCADREQRENQVPFHRADHDPVSNNGVFRPGLMGTNGYFTSGMPGWSAGRGPGAGQKNLRSVSRMGTSLMLDSRRSIRPRSSYSHSSLP